MTESYPCGGFGRRRFLAGFAGLPALAGTFASAQEPKAARDPKALESKLGAPGPYPGRVVEARNPAMMKDGVRDRDAIRKTLGLALTTLTGADDPVEGWRTFFEAGDVVGIKVVPNGAPLAYSSPELVLEVIEGLKAAGVKTEATCSSSTATRSEFCSAPDERGRARRDDFGAALTPEADGHPAPARSFPRRRPRGRLRPRRVRRDEPRPSRRRPEGRPQLPPLAPRHAGHQAGEQDRDAARPEGSRLGRRHRGPEEHEPRLWSTTSPARTQHARHERLQHSSSPQVVSHPIIRKKCVLQIMDGIRGIFQGGPFGPEQNAHWAWEYNALLMATDPVALDHIEWDIIDAKRKEKGLAPVGAVGKLGQDAEREGFDIRQPQHIPLAANLGLGIFDHKSPLGRKFQIDHRVVTAS